MVVDKHILVIDVVAGQQQSHGRREAHAAVRAVGRQPFIAVVGADFGGEIVGVRQGMEAEHIVAYPHLLCREVHVFKTGDIIH